MLENNDMMINHAIKIDIKKITQNNSKYHKRTGRICHERQFGNVRWLM